MRTQEEQWRQVVGHEQYEISSLGRVRGPKGYRKIQEGRNGYYYLSLYTVGKETKVYLHRLIAEAFIPNPDGKPEVNHKDRNKDNNDISNLEWVTHSENHIHLREMGCLVGEGNGMASLTQSKVLEILNLKGKLSQRKIAKLYNTTQSNIWKIHRGTRWKHITR